MKNFAKYAIYTGLWAVLLIPFYVANTMFFPYITGKNFAFRIIVELIFAIWLYLAYIDEKYRPKFSWIVGAVSLFVLIMAIADLNAVAPMKAFMSNYERMDGWVTLIHLLMYVIVFGSFMKGEKIWNNFFKTSLAFSVIMIIPVIKEWVTTGTGRVSVTLGNPIYVAIYFLFNFFLALILLNKELIKNKTDSFKAVFSNWFTYIYSIAAIICAYGIWRTGTRGVIIGLIGGLIVASIIILIFEKNNKLTKKVSIVIITASVIIFGLFFALKNTDFVKNNGVLSRFASLSLNSNEGRRYVWPMAIEGFQEKPLLGWGQDGFNYIFNKYYDARMYNQEQWFDRAHDMPLDMLVAGGILGLVSYLLIFVALIYLIWKNRKQLM